MTLDVPRTQNNKKQTIYSMNIYWTDAVAELLEHRPLLREIWSPIHDRVKRMTWYLPLPSMAFRFASIGQDCFAQNQDNGSEWDIGSWCLAAWFISGAALQRLPRVGAVTSWYSTGHDLRCCEVVKLFKKKHLLINVDLIHITQV